MESFIYVMLAVVFGAFVFFIYYAMRGGSRGGRDGAVAIPAGLPEKLQIEVKQKEDAVEILVYNPDGSRKSDAEIFPDIVNDTAPPKGALDRAFWDKVSHLGDISEPDERERLVRVLAEQGIIPKESVTDFSMPDPGADPGMEDAGEDAGDDDYRNELDSVVDEDGFYFYV